MQAQFSFWSPDTLYTHGCFLDFKAEAWKSVTVQRGIYFKHTPINSICCLESVRGFSCYFLAVKVGARVKAFVFLTQCSICGKEDFKSGTKFLLSKQNHNFAEDIAEDDRRQLQKECYSSISNENQIWRLERL